MQQAALQLIKAIGDLNAVWTPHDGQRAILYSVFGAKNDVTFAELGRKAGKALALDTPIPTPNGWAQMGDIKAGDTVFDETGTPCRVLQAHDVLLGEPCYEVVFGDGEKIVASGDHLWFTSTKQSRKSKQRTKDPIQPGIRTTVQIADTLRWGKEWNHSIDNTKPLQIAPRALPIDPYVLGAWLGDGSRDGARFTNPDIEVIAEIKAAGYGVTSNGNGLDHYILKPFISQIRALGVLNDKHIPDDYLWGSYEQRLGMVQGLMDTDGTICDRGHCEFSASNERLAVGMRQLLHGLGVKTTIKSRIPKCQTGFGALSYRVCFKPHIPVFRLSRKLARQTAKKKPLHRFIVGVDPIPSVPVRCLTVDSPSRLYLAGFSMIPTHNTEVLAYFLWRMALSVPGGHYYFAPEQKQAKEIIWASGRLQNFGPKEYIRSINNSEMRVTFTNGSYIKADGSDNFDAYRGIEPHSAVYDEFRDFRPEFHKAFGPNLGVFKAPLFIGTTPPEALELDHYDAMVEEAKHAGGYFNMPTWVNPIIEKDWIRRQRDKLIARGEWDVFEREYGAKRVRGGSNAIFPMFDNKRHVFPHKQLMDEVMRDATKLVWQVGCDPGNATCFAVVFRAINPYTKKVYVLDEIYETNQADTSTSRIMPRIRAKRDELFPNWQAHRIDWEQIYDEAATWFATEALNSYDEHFTPTVKATRPKDFGLSLLKDQMLGDLIVFSDRCKNTVKELAGYIRDKDGKIPKKNDHTIDVNRYLNAFSSVDLVPELEPAKPDAIDMPRAYTYEQDEDNEPESLDDYEVDY